MSWVLPFCKGFEGPSQFFPELWPCVFASATLGPKLPWASGCPGIVLGRGGGPKLQTIKLFPGFIFHSITMCEQRDGDLLYPHPFSRVAGWLTSLSSSLAKGLFPKIQAAHEAWKAFEKLLGNSQPMHRTWGVGRKSQHPHQWFCWSWGQSICMWPSQAQALTAGCRRTLPRPCGNFLAALSKFPAAQLLQELQLQDGCNHQVWPGWRAFALPLQRACHVPKGTIAL